jgi:hypothetical protein
VQWWVGTDGPLVSMCSRGGFISMQTKQSTPFLLHLTPPRLRTGESMHLLVCFWPSFAHIHGEAGTLTEGICSALVGRNRRSVGFYVQQGWIYFHANQTIDPILATFDATPSPHGRINAPTCLLLAFIRPHPWRGGNVNGGHLQCSGGSEPTVRWFLCAEEVDLFPCKPNNRPHSCYI